MNFDFNAFKPYQNKFGQITQKSGDAGDTCHKTSIAAACLRFLNGDDRYFNALGMPLLESGGIVVRETRDTAKPIEWWNDPRATSRDQKSRYMVSCMYNDKADIVKRTWDSLVGNYCFHQNDMEWHADTGTWTKKIPDIMGVGEWRNHSRFLSDGIPPVMLDSSFYADLKARQRQQWDYDLLMFPDLIFSLEFHSSSVTRDVWQLYQKTNALQCMVHYFTKNPDEDVVPMADLITETWNALVDKYPPTS